MSSDYGSDILSDDILPDNENAQPVAATPCTPNATPRVPLKPRDANVPATPPPSQVKKSNDADGRVSASQTAVVSCGRQVPQHQFPTPTSTLSKPPSGRHGPAAYQNAPSSSQPLTTPMTARMAPPAQYMPSSSQPTPSKKPAIPRGPVAALPAQTLPSVHHIPAADSSQCDQASLYRFPFGTHRGKTLLEVPENYIAYLRVDQDMADSMSGFTTVLRRFDAGEPPALPLPPPPPPVPSQPKSHEVPPSSAPARISNPPIMNSQESSPSTPVAHAEYRFDFGKHVGKLLAEVPTDYIDFLKQRGIVESKPALAVAVIKHEREQARSAPVATSSRSEPAVFTLRFGKHKGKTLDEVPSDYVTWLKRSSDMYNESQALRDAIAAYERKNKSTHTKPCSKRKRAPEVPSTRYSRASGTAKSAPKKKRRVPTVSMGW